MHDSSLLLIEKILKILYPEPLQSVHQKLNVLDVGSAVVQGQDASYRKIIESRGWDYTGIDIESGPNVDIVVPPYNYPFNSQLFDLVISGQAVEHVRYIWRWIEEIYRLVSINGHAIILGPSEGKIHFKVDCWRILPDGMVALLEWAGFREIQTDRSSSRWRCVAGWGRK